MHKEGIERGGRQALLQRDRGKLSSRILEEPRGGDQFLQPFRVMEKGTSENGLPPFVQCRPPADHRPVTADEGKVGLHSRPKGERIPKGSLVFT